MSKLARVLALVAVLAAMNLAAMTTVAHAYPLDPASQRHRALGQLESTADAGGGRLEARERSSIPNLAPAQTQVASPLRSGERGWRIPALRVLAAVLALVAAVAVVAARRAHRSQRASQTA
jgi:hypothetical protein